MPHHDYYVYITTNANRSALYIGMTNNMADGWSSTWIFLNKEWWDEERPPRVV